MLAAENKADFVVSLAGVAVPGRETLLWQNREGLLQAGLDEKTVESYCRALSDTFDAATGGLPLPAPGDYDLPAALKQNLAAVQAQLDMPYLRHFVQLDLAEQLGRITCPVLALNGTKDTQVDCAANLGALKQGLPASARNEIRSLDGLNHLFQHCSTGLAAEYPQIEETFSPEALSLIAGWLQSLRF